MSDQFDQLLGVFGGLAVLLATTGLALRLDRAAFERRLWSAFAIMQPRRPTSGARPNSARPTRQAIRLAFLRWLRPGADPEELSRVGLSLTPRRFLAFQLAAGLLGAAVGRLAAGRFDFEGSGLPAAVALGGILGFALPRIVMGLLYRRRLGRFERQFPLAVDSVANALEAGLSLPQGLELVGRDMPAPVGVEFGRVFRELGMGLSLSEALAGLARRMPLSDVEIFVTAIDIQYRTGGNLSTILRTIAHTVRERLRIRGEIRVMTTQQRISAWILSALPLVIFMAMKFMNANYADKVLQPGVMRWLVLGAILSVCSGFYVLNRIANIEV